MFAGPNTQFKNTLRSFRQSLFALGYNHAQVATLSHSYKLRKRLLVMTVSALSTATTVGTRYTSPNGQMLTVQATAPVGATTIMLASETGLPDSPPSTLTVVAGSIGSGGTAQTTISYSADPGAPPFLGPYMQMQEPVTVRSQL
jgi:hypothetical protein